jgi:hypothetical protein
VAFDEEGRAYISEAYSGPTGENSPEYITEVLKECKFKPFDHLFEHLTFSGDKVCLIYGDCPISDADFNADNFLNAVNTGPDAYRLTATELKNFYALLDDNGVAKIVFHHDENGPWF